VSSYTQVVQPLSVARAVNPAATVESASSTYFDPFSRFFRGLLFGARSARMPVMPYSPRDTRIRRWILTFQHRNHAFQGLVHIVDRRP